MTEGTFTDYTDVADLDPAPLGRSYPTIRASRDVSPVDPAASYADYLDATGAEDDAAAAADFAAGQRAATRATESRRALTTALPADGVILPGPVGGPRLPAIPPMPMPERPAPRRRRRIFRR